MKITGLPSGSYNAQIPDVASLEQMIQDLLHYQESEPITPEIIQLEEIVAIKIKVIREQLNHISNRLHHELHPEEYEHA